MTYEKWEMEVPETIRLDALWRVRAYRLSLFLSDLAWHDTLKMLEHPRMISTADQLFRACGKISACIAEGYSRGTGRDRARFYEYALGSVREARDWYYKARRCLPEAAFTHRMELTTEITRLLLTMIGKDRRQNRRLGEMPVT